MQSVIPRRPRRNLLLALLAALPLSTAQAYQVGDAVDPAVLQQLGAQPGKVVVVDFFAEWCESCRKELPLISALKSRVNAQNVQFVGIDTDNSEEVAKAFQAEMQAKGALNFPVVNDLEQTLVAQFKPKGFPALYIVQDGKVAKAHLGATPNIDNLIEADLKALTQP